MKLTGRDGVLRIYDSSPILLGAAPRDEVTVDVVTWDGASTWTNITSSVDTDDTNYASDFLADNDDAVFIGADVMFAMIRFLKDGASQYAVGSGALKMFYFDGSDFSKSITAFEDGTASGGNCFAQDGYIGFKIPKDWAIGANAVNAALDADKYYVKLMTTTSPSVDPDADVLCPVDAQYFEVAFANMDFNGPLGRPKTEERLVLERGTANSKMHYIEGVDNTIFEAVALAYSAALDTVYNKDDLLAAMECGNPGSARWTAAGVTSKGTTKNDGSNYNPAFADSGKKCVNVQIRFAKTTGIPIGVAYYETYFPPDEQSLAEDDDAITVSCNGGVFGVIELIHGFGVRY